MAYIKKRLIIFILLFIFLIFVSTTSFISSQNFYISYKGVHYDSEIIDNLENSQWVKIIVHVNEDTNIKIIGLKQDTKKLQIKKFDLLKLKIDKVVQESKSKNINRIIRSYRGFSAEVNRYGLNELLNNPDINFIYLNKPAEINIDMSAQIIHAKNVWNLTSIGYNGSGIKVCVIDTGVNDTHPYLLGRIKGQHCFCSVSEGNNSYCCSGNYNESDDATDLYGHGTHVVGIIASQNSTYKGIAYGADIYVVKVFNSTAAGYFSDVERAVDWCNINVSANIISMSIGDGSDYSNESSCPSYMGDSINDSYNNGIILIASSGNNGYTNGINYPACAPHVISVGATNKSDGFYDPVTSDYFGNKWPNLDLLAPGYSIYSLRLNPNYYSTSACWETDPYIMFCSGTSQAAPHVAAAVALMLQNDSTLTPDKALSRLQDNGVKVSNWSRIDVYAAITQVIGNFTYIDTCGILNKTGEIYKLTHNISSSGTCMNITADNIVIDGQGYNIFYTQISNGYGIYALGHKNITVKNLNIINNRTSSVNSSGIFFINGSNNYIFNNSFYIMGNISLSSDTYNNGIYLYQINNTIIENNLINITNNKGSGIVIESFDPGSFSINNKILKNYIYTNGSESKGIFLYAHKKSGISDGGLINNSVIIDNKIETKGYQSSGIHLTGGITKNAGSVNISRTNITTYGLSEGIYFITIESDSYIYDSNIFSVNGNCIHIAPGNTKSFYFINVSYNNEAVESGQLIRKWYLNAQVNYSNGTFVNQANVTAWNVSGNWQFSELTDSSGQISQKELIEYVNNGATKIYYTNYTINATKNGIIAQKSFNLTGNLNLLLTLDLLELNDTHKYYHKDSSGNAVAWLGNKGNIVLKGKCYYGGTCNNPGDGSLIFRNESNYNLGYINITGDLCIIKGDCSDESSNCNSPADGAFIIANSTSYVSYIDGEGDLCLTGKLYQNINL